MSRVNKCGRDPRYLAAKTMLKKNRYDDGIAALTTLLEAYVKKFSDSSIEAARPHYEYANALLFKVENTQDFLGGAAGTATNDSKASSGGAAGAGAGAGAGKEAQANLMARAQEMVTAAQEAEEDVQIAFECFEVARVNVEKFLEDGCEDEALEREATLLLANVHERVGDLLQFNNHHEAMLEEYRRALELRLGAKHEEQLSHSYFMVGLAYELCMKKRGVESPERLSDGAAAKGCFRAVIRLTRGKIAARKAELSGVAAAPKEEEQEEEGGKGKGKGKGKAQSAGVSSSELAAEQDDAASYPDDAKTEFPEDAKLQKLRDTVQDLGDRISMIDSNLSAKIASLSTAHAQSDVASAALASAIQAAGDSSSSSSSSSGGGALDINAFKEKMGEMVAAGASSSSSSSSSSSNPFAMPTTTTGFSAPSVASAGAAVRDIGSLVKTKKEGKDKGKGKEDGGMGEDGKENGGDAPANKNESGAAGPGSKRKASEISGGETAPGAAAEPASKKVALTTE